MSDHSRQSVLFPDLFAKSLHVAFDEPQTTSDGGATLLKALDESLGLTRSLAGCLRDSRCSGKVDHTFEEMIRQRVFGLACGYADVNDVSQTGQDPMHRLLVDRDPEQGPALASQSTLSRFENTHGPVALRRMAGVLGELVLQRHQRRLGRKRVRRITIDLDPTDDPTHGMQQLTLFNGFYGTWCYLPLLGFVTFNDEPEQYLFCAMLRSGRAKGWDGAIGILRRTIARLRDLFPTAKIRVRLDGGFACPEMFDFLDDEKVEYLVAMAKNSVLERFACKDLNRARRRARKSGVTETEYGEAWYAAGTWKGRKRRVIYKAEVVCLKGHQPRDNARFVITNLKLTPKNAYQCYRQRGDVENRIKELHEGVYLDRTSCSRFWANQFRVLLSAAAYIIFQELRLRLRRTDLGRAQVSTLRLHLLKIAGRIRVSVRRVVVHLSQSHPWRSEWLRAAKACHAVVT